MVVSNVERTVSVRMELLLVRVVLITWFQLQVLHQRMIAFLVRILSNYITAEHIIEAHFYPFFNPPNPFHDSNQ